MSNKRINKAYIRYDGNGRVIPGALLLNRFKPTGGGKWHEIPAYECCNPVTTLALRLLFDDIANVPVADATSVADWNTFFDLPTNGSPFTSVVIVGNEVQLIGGSGITLRDYLFDYDGNTHLLEINDDAQSIVAIGTWCFGGWDFAACNNLTSLVLPALLTIQESGIQDTTALINVYAPLLQTIGMSVFYNCPSLINVNFPSLLSIGDSCFFNCTSLTTISIPSCTALGSTTGNDGVFNSISGNTITLTVPSALMTCNSGNPDGDIQYLQANNTVTVITV